MPVARVSRPGTGIVFFQRRPCKNRRIARRRLLELAALVFDGRLKIDMSISIAARANLELIEENYQRWRANPRSMLILTTAGKTFATARTDGSAADHPA